MTAAERLIALSGGSGTAGERLMRLAGAAGLAGGLLVGYSGLGSASAAQHLLHDKVTSEVRYMSFGPSGHSQPVKIRKDRDDDLLILLL
jgi:hypothetical protein